MPPQSGANDYSKLYLPGAILLAGVLVAGGLYFGLSSQGGASVGGAAQPKVDIKDVSTDGDPYIGDKNAPVTLAFWADFQCPYCKAVEVGHPQIPIDPAVPDLIKQYVETGKLRIVFKDYPFLGEDSITGAEYARAVWDLYPEQYFAFRTAMYEEQDEEGDQGFGDAASIDEMIRTELPQMDLAKVKQALESNQDKYDAAITANREEGVKFGIQGTPGFITGKTLIPGAAPLSDFTSVIDPQLK
ncbi:MAG: thioredoxin domain-containing protein [Patescibacteria group bacterium]|nr:thioredoxin domain-containing protein [Patescibacteria group bacterium]